MSEPVRETDLPGVPLFRRGKVRDTYDLGDHLLMVASDRVSAFDVVLPSLIPQKGVVLTQLSRFWFEQTSGLIPNHLLTADVNAYPAALGSFREQLIGRSMMVRKAERIDVECVVRGYLAGSAWAEYEATGMVGGETVPDGLRFGDRLQAPVFTPALKLDDEHDANMTGSDLRQMVGVDLAQRLEEASRDLYDVAASLALRRGLLLADTKFEFGLIDGVLTVIDELLTPDSSRYWDATVDGSGTERRGFDKQIVRDWLDGTGWDRRPPGPTLPAAVVAETSARYVEAFERLTGSSMLGGQESR